VSGFGQQMFYGGTSFVGPQLNGVTGLIDSTSRTHRAVERADVRSRATIRGLYGQGAPFNVIKYGNNDFYVGRDGYSPAAGIGTLNVSDFAEALKKIHEF